MYQLVQDFFRPHYHTISYPKRTNEVNRYDETYSLAEHWREAVTHMRAGPGPSQLDG